MTRAPSRFVCSGKNERWAVVWGACRGMQTRSRPPFGSSYCCLSMILCRTSCWSWLFPIWLQSPYVAISAGDDARVLRRLLSHFVQDQVPFVQARRSVDELVRIGHGRGGWPGTRAPHSVVCGALRPIRVAYSGVYRTSLPSTYVHMYGVQVYKANNISAHSHSQGASVGV